MTLVFFDNRVQNQYFLISNMRVDVKLSEALFFAKRGIKIPICVVYLEHFGT